MPLYRVEQSREEVVRLLPDALLGDTLSIPLTLISETGVRAIGFVVGVILCPDGIIIGTINGEIANLYFKDDGSVQLAA